MNIKEAKEQVKNAMVSYFAKDDSGEYILPIEKQRPVFLVGPPGIGKTAIMEQIASEMKVGLLSYSMTHHTRQSALGLPFIERKNYQGVEYDVSTYTMSEIISSVYELMENSGVTEGILFLDEINCVSETLTPIMLQFLQYKIFGRHRVPDGWIVVTAGNPPEYNNSVHEFDIVTLDRLKRIDVEPDFDVWKEYAYLKGIHPAVMTYLEIKQSDFYSVKSTVDGKTFVTARGWEDLSQMIRLYERNVIKVDGNLISQYVQNPRIAKDFVAYYDLFLKYKSDYQVNDILSGKTPEEIKARAKKAKFDERLFLIGMLLDSVGERLSAAVELNLLTKELMDVLLEYKAEVNKRNKKPAEQLSELIEAQYKKLEGGKASGAISREAARRLKKIIEILTVQKESIAQFESGDEAFEHIKMDLDARLKDSKKLAGDAGKHLTNMFSFCEEVFPDGQEMLIIVTELTINPISASFINKFGCKEYFKHNKDLLLYDRQKEIMNEIKNL